MTSPPSLLATDDCLFLDLDGTLLHLRDDPATIPADAALLRLLEHCAARLGGALAIISGRPIADLDACFEPLRFAVAGIHGAERRRADGTTITALAAHAAALRSAAQQLANAMAHMPQTLLEDKGSSIALHWRRAPRFEAPLRELAQSVLEQLGPDYRLLEGNCVVELLPRTTNKGEAVRAFLDESPFRGRKPVYVGDDVTDLPGFAAARAAGGYGIAVGDRVASDYHFDDVNAVREWLGDA
jgi:trehalose 6-phosphate phosphatase